MNGLAAASGSVGSGGHAEALGSAHDMGAMGGAGIASSVV
jgi:hypothetical protein